jgi:hypothetical protein
VSRVVQDVKASLRSLHRERQGESRTAFGPVFGGDGSAMELDEVAHDCQAQAGAPRA